MPNRKEIEIIRRIQNVGYLLEFDQTPQLNLPKLKIEHHPYESFVFAFCDGMGVILGVRITSDRDVRIQDFGDLKLGENWCDVDWWANEKSDVYRFLGGPEYPRDIVLNHRIDVLVKRGQPLEGLLLGRSSTRIPSMCSHGFRLPMTHSVFDGFGNAHSAQVLLQVDEQLCSKSQRQSRGSLYGPRSVNKPKHADGLKNLVLEEQSYANLLPFGVW
jgi:hypothetical protein